MRGGALPIVLLVLFLGLAIGLMSIPYLVREDSPVVTESAPLVFGAQFGGGRATGRLEAADRRFSLTLSLDRDYRVEMPISLSLVMPEHAMSPLVPRLSQVTEREFTASGILPMTGRWELQIQTPNGQTTIPFRVEK